mmetsp:Transcript_152763/g.266857  ORF Transcript_152763/g.266857 Transcript_152763/m.266857 type:complete len:108 (-) Transcript_152763:564-887(-)
MLVRRTLPSASTSRPLTCCLEGLNSICKVMPHHPQMQSLQKYTSVCTYAGERINLQTSVCTQLLGCQKPPTQETNSATSTLCFYPYGTASLFWISGLQGKMMSVAHV